METAGGRGVRDVGGRRRGAGTVSGHGGQRDARRGRAAGEARRRGDGEDGAHGAAAVQPAGHVRPVRRELRDGVPGQRRRSRHADRGAVRPGNVGTGHGRGGRARGPAPGRRARHGAAGPGRAVRAGAGAARGRGQRAGASAGRPAVLRGRGHAVDRGAGGPGAVEHGARPDRVLPDRVQRVRPGGGVRPERVAQPFPGEPGHRLLAAVRLRRGQRVQDGPDGRGRLRHVHPRLGQRGRRPVREVRARPSRGRVPRRRPGPGARLPRGRVRPRAARAQGAHVRQHALRDVRQRGPVRQHHLPEPGTAVRIRSETRERLVPGRIRRRRPGTAHQMTARAII